MGIHLTSVEIFWGEGAIFGGGEFLVGTAFLGGNIPGDSFPGGNFLGGNFPESSFLEGNLPRIDSYMHIVTLKLLSLNMIIIATKRKRTTDTKKKFFHKLESDTNKRNGFTFNNSKIRSFC